MNMHTPASRSYRIVGSGVLIIVCLLIFKYQSYLLVSSDIRGGLRGQVFLIIRPAHHGPEFNEVGVLTDGTFAVVKFTPNGAGDRVLVQSPVPQSSQQEVKALRAWCEHPPPPAGLFESSTYTVGLRCESLVDLRSFTVSFDQIPPFLRESLQDT
jgi:hypothetical protein